MRKVPICILWVVYIGIIHANVGEDRLFRRLSPEGGFYHDGIKSIVQDENNFVWIMMDYGLYRFDGYEYKSYYDYFCTLNKAVGWVFNNAAADRSGRLLVSTSNGLFCYEKEYDTFTRLTNIPVNHVEIDDMDNIWVKTAEGMGILDPDGSTVFVPLCDGNPFPGLRNLLCINASDLYTFSENGSVFHYDYKKKEFKLCLKLQTHNSSVIDAKIHKGKLWVLMGEGLYKIDLPTYAVEEYFAFKEQLQGTYPSRSLFIDQTGEVWVGTINGIFVLNPADKTYTHYLHSQSDPLSLPHNSVWTIAGDRQQNIWIGTYSGALCYVNVNERRAFNSFFPEEKGLNQAPVSAFAEDEDYLWIGTEGGGLNRMEKSTGQFTAYTHDLTSNTLSYNNVKSMVIDRGKKLWIAMFKGGLDCFDTQKRRFIHYRNDKEDPNSLYFNDLRTIALEADSGLWVAYQSRKPIVSFLSFKHKKFTHYNFDEAGDYYIFDILRGRDETLWILNEKGLFALDVKARVKREIQIPDSLFMNANCMCSDDLGHIWIGTRGNGLIRYEPDVSRYTLYKDILKYDASVIYAICTDEEGNIWMGTNNGLFRYTVKSDLLTHFDNSDGLQGRVYYPLSSMKRSNGELLFGGTAGFTIVYPHKVTAENPKPQAFISDILINNISVQSAHHKETQKHEISISDKLVLDYNQNNFGFKFSSDNYSNPEKTLFKYRLRGYDDRWIETDASNRMALYSKVPAGTYYFEVMAAVTDMVWGDPMVIKIKCRPAPWFSWWAYIIYFMAVLWIVITLLRYYYDKKKLEFRLYADSVEKDKKDEIHQSQLRFFTNISHDFRTPLSLILAVVDNLRREGMKEHYCQILQNNTQRLLNLVNELMQFRSIENGKMKLILKPVNINQTVRELCADFEEYAHQHQITYRIICNPDVPEQIYLDKGVFEKILMNLINNALKHTTKDGEISIETFPDSRTFISRHANSFTVGERQCKSGYFGVVIRDTGIGISKESIRNVFERFYKVNTDNADAHLGTGIGLALVKSLVLLHRGSITIYSEKGVGTDILVCLPLSEHIYAKEELIEVGKEEPAEAMFIDTAIIQEQPDDEWQEKRQRVMLVEDNNELRTLVADFFSPHYDIIEAKDGLVASELLLETEPDLIITDIMMPGKDGIILSREVKGNVNTSHIPIILLTAKTGMENKIEGAEAGADVYFEKPIDLNLLLLSVHNIFERQKILREYYAKNFYADSAELSSNTNDNKFMRQLIDVIEKNLNNPMFDVNYLASQIAMSRSKLYSKVKAMTGKTIVGFILNYKLKRAAQLIIEQDVSMLQIMEQVGIESQAYFTNAFKKEFGVTPSAFALKHRKMKINHEDNIGDNTL